VLAGTASVFAQAPAAPPGPPRAPPDLAPRIAHLADRLASINAQADRLTDYDELRNLQQIYGYYFDKALWDQVLDLFAEDAQLEVGQQGRFIGRPSIRRYLYGLTGGRQGLVQGQLNNHFQLSPVITLAPDGQTARARWRLMVQDGQLGVIGNWGAGIYENEYVKQDGVWKIQRLKLFVKFYAPYEGGWTRTTVATNARYGKSTAHPDQPNKAPLAGWPFAFEAPMHFGNPARTDYRLAPPDAARATAGSPRTVAALEAQVRALELKLARLRAAEEVERLESTYGYYADKSMQDAISALFAEDSTLEILGRGVFVGRDRVYEYMRRLGTPSDGTLFNHMQLQPVVTVSPDGNSAQIRAHLLVMFGREGDAAQWGDGIYENTFVRENGSWKYRSLAGFQTFYTTYDQGWGRQAMPMLSYFPGYPPDLPQSVKYDPYPAPFVPPFHFRNPVTGR
jgi:SnoaL-like domain